ncbi:hypothetical protein ES703_68313 [subsurface metagenome]
MIVMSEIRFQMRPVTEKREKKLGRRSIYDPMIDQFLESGNVLVEIEVEGKKPGYVAGMLKKRIKGRGLKLKATAVSDVVYLEKV